MDAFLLQIYVDWVANVFRDNFSSVIFIANVFRDNFSSVIFIALLYYETS